jgi:hypothetical protein
MSEESQLDAMRAAIRGDFERLAERRGEQELMRVHEDRAVSSATEDDEARPATSEVDVASVTELAAADSATTAVEPDAEPEPEQAPDEPLPRRSWLARLLGL